jgi:hypothetical protein
MHYKNIGFLLLILFAINSCCMFGYTTTEELVWERKNSGDAQEDVDTVKNQCRTEVIKQCKIDTKNNCTDIISGKMHPKFINYSTGKEYKNPEIEKDYQHSCQQMLNDQDLLDNSCKHGSQFFSLDYEIDACMKRNGFQLVTKKCLACKPMPLF